MCLLILSTMQGTDRVQLSVSRSLKVSPLPVWKQSVPVTGCQESLHFFWGAAVHWASSPRSAQFHRVKTPGLKTLTDLKGL
jgi:hypothetical protein